MHGASTVARRRYASNNAHIPLSIEERMNTIDQELIEAAEENNLPEVGRLVSVGADMNAKDNDGFAPLHVACFEGHVQVVKVLQEHGADIEIEDNDGWRPLHCACWHGHLAVVNELMSPNDSNGAITSILGKRKSRGSNIEAKDRNGNTPLHFASIQDHPAMVKAFLSGGADIFAANNEGFHPIHRAVSGGHSAVTKCLLQHIYATTRRLPLHKLLEDLAWIVDPNRSLFAVPPLRTALHLSVLGMDDVVEILEYLAGHNPALISSRNQDGALPLHVACRLGVSFSIVQSLVNLYKASVKSVTPQGDLPLFLACEMPETSLDTIFLLMKLYPELVYR
jgi:ankyrin repeat protein